MITVCRTVHDSAPSAWATASEGVSLDDAAVAATVEAGRLPIETARSEGGAAAWVVSPEQAMELLARGVAGWRISVRHEGTRADVLDAVVRTGAVMLRTTMERIGEACELAGLPALSTTV